MKKSSSTHEDLEKELAKNYRIETAVIHPDSPLLKAVYMMDGVKLPYAANDALKRNVFVLVEVHKHKLISYHDTFSRDVILYVNSLVNDLEASRDPIEVKRLANVLEKVFNEEINDVAKLKQIVADELSRKL